MYYYAYIDENSVVTGTYGFPSQVSIENYIYISQTDDPKLVSKIYNSETGEFEEPIYWSCTSNEVRYKDTTQSVSGKFDIIDTTLNEKADSNHTHSQYATLSDVYPIGSIYMSTDNTNPSSLFGGTWVAFGEGRMVMGVSAYGSSMVTGGSETASIASHTHTTQGHTLTLNEIPSHNHALLNYNVDGNTIYTFTNNSVTANIKKGYDGNVMTTYKGGNQSHSHGDTGSAGATTINILPPYITVHMWRRTL